MEKVIVEKRKKHTYRGFEITIYKVFKQEHPELQISKRAINQINEFTELLAIELSKTAHSLTRFCDKQTIGSREIQNATRIVLSGELQKNAVACATIAVTKWNADAVEKEPKPIGKKMMFGMTKGQKGPKKERAEHRAGITFPVTRCRNYVKLQGESGYRSGKGASIYLAGVLESVVREFILQSGDRTIENKKKTITTRFLYLSIGTGTGLGSDFYALFKRLNVTLLGSGADVKIHDELVDGSNKKTLKKIKKYQQSIDLLIQKAPFERITRALLNSIEVDIRCSADIIWTLQNFIENFMVLLYQKAQEFAIYAKKISIDEAAILLALKSSCKVEINLDAKTVKQHERILKKFKPLSDPAFKRLASKAGAKRITSEAVLISKQIITFLVFMIAENMVVFTHQARMKTVTRKSLDSSLKSLGFNFIV